MKDSFAKISSLQNSVSPPRAYTPVINALIDRATPYTLEDDINLTPPPRQSSEDNPIYKLLLRMKPGQSFLVEDLEGISPEKVRSSIIGITKKVKKTTGYSRWEFTSRRVKEGNKLGFRFWRVK